MASELGIEEDYNLDDISSPTANPITESVDLNNYVPASEYDQLAEQLKAANQARIRAEHQCRKAEERGEQLISMHKSTQSILVHRQKGQVSAHKAEVDSLKQLVEDDQQQILTLKAKIDALENNKDASNFPVEFAEIRQLSVTVAELRGQVEELKQGNVAARAEVMEYQRMAEDAQQRLMMGESQAHSLQLEQLLALQTQLDKLLLERRVEDADEEEGHPLAVSLLSEVEVLRKQRTESEAVIAKLRQQLVLGDNTPVEDQDDEAKSQALADAEAKITALTAELVTMAQTMTMLQSAGDDTAGVAEELVSARKAAAKAAEDAKAKDELLKKSDAVVKKREEQLKQLKDNAQTKLKEASEHIKKLKSEYGSLRDAYQALKLQSEDKLKALHQQLINSRSASAAQRKRALEAMQADVAAIRADAERVKQELATSSAAGMGNMGSVIVAEVQKRMSAQSEHIALLRDNYERELKLRKKVFNQLQELKGNIRVYARLRPMGDKERADKANHGVVTIPRDGELKIDNSSKKQVFNFEFEKVFSPQSTQAEVFDEVQDLVLSVLDGFNVCIFAYGQTGSGKTFTMEGPKENPGVNTRALEKLFADVASKQGEWDYGLRITLLEIYNEKVQDLLSDDPSPNLKVVQGKEGMSVLGLTHAAVSSADEVQKLLQRGKKNRHVTKTDMNEHSSRSHLILSVYAAGTNRLTGASSMGKLHLIDLAGSERISRSGVTGEALKEAQKINYSLSALGNVISARANRKEHVPYRDSMLTYLLQDSLEKNSKTLMFVQLSPAVESVNETVCSLRFAERVRKVELGKAGRNVSQNQREQPEEEEE